MKILKMLVNWGTVVGVIIGAGVVGFFMYNKYSTSRPVVTINGEAITKKDLQDRTDYLYTDKLLRGMIWRKLIFQEAKKDNVMPTDADVQQTIAQLDRTTPSVVNEAKKSDPGLDLFKEQIKADLALRNLRIKDVPLTDGEARAFYAKHKTQFSLPQQTKTTIVIAGDAVDADAAQRMLHNGVSLDTLAQQRGMAVIGVTGNFNGPPPDALKNTVMTMKLHDIRIVPLGAQYGNQFAIVRADGIAPYGTPRYEQIKPLVDNAAKLAKAGPESKELALLRSTAKITADVPKYESAIPTSSDNQVASAQ